MSLGNLPRTRFLNSGDPVLHPGWPLLDFLLSIGCDEFAVTFTNWGDGVAGDRLVGLLAFASIGERTRERTVTYVGQQNPRAMEAWRLDRPALLALREVMPAGVMGEHFTTRGPRAEDLCVYRQSALVFGVVTHENLAFLRLTDAEWRRWSRRSAAQRRET